MIPARLDGEAFKDLLSTKAPHNLRYHRTYPQHIVRLATPGTPLND
jgi:hypothetical protein